METQLVKDFKELSLYRHNWDKLLRSYCGRDIFLTYEWIITWWEHFGEDKELYILFVWDKQQLCGIAPLMKIYRCPFHIFELIGQSGYSDYSDRVDFILDNNKSDNVLKAITDFLLQKKEEWHLISLQRMSPLSGNADKLVNILKQKETKFLNQEADKCFYTPISLFKDFEDYLHKNFGGNKRRQLRRLRRKLFSEKGVRAVDLDKIDENLELFDKLVNLDRNKSSRGRQGKSFFSKDKAQGFFNDFLHKVKNQDILRIKTYWVGEEIISFIIGFYYAHKYLAYQKAFDSGYGKYSLGNLLLWDITKEAFQKGYKEIDFLLGDERYKTQWTNHFRQNRRILIYNSSLLSRLLYLYHKKIKPLRPLIKQSKIAQRLWAG